VCLNVLRIYREALTNALKQLGATRVAVRFAVDPSRLVLVVENDGAAEARGETGIDAGRGLANLRARATELGGRLDLELGADARLWLEVPLPWKSPDVVSPASADVALQSDRSA
jgi:signal transduction histidine kinase